MMAKAHSRRGLLFFSPTQMTLSGFVVSIGHDHENVPASVFAALLTSVTSLRAAWLFVLPGLSSAVLLQMYLTHELRFHASFILAH